MRLRGFRVLSAQVWECQRTATHLYMYVAWVKSCLSLFCRLQGSIVLTNLTALHRDPAEWATPDTFNPEHFLENGQFKKRESFLPFSIGEYLEIGVWEPRVPLSALLLLSQPCSSCDTLL